jgi:outer membrane protein, multidrug efflux system
MLRKPLILFIAVLSAACSTTSEVLKPQIDMPAAYREPVSGQTDKLTQEWWRAFGSQELGGLIAAAFEESPDLAIAVERVRQAEAQTRIAGASLFPELSGGVGTGRSDNNRRDREDDTSASLSASYELDVWGLNASGRRAARASQLATEFDEDSVRLTLAAGVADAYFQVLSLRGRIAIARANLRIAERVLGIVESRHRNGAVSALDVARQNASVLQFRASITALELQERQTLHALAILVGRPPQNFEVQGLNVNALAVPVVDPGLPADLLVRRPDLAVAEAQLVAANADLAAARAALLPGVRLTGALGISSPNLASFASPTTLGSSIAASVLQTIFDGGRLRAQVDSAGSRERELVENYRKAILSALADVEDALAATSRTAQQQDLQIRARDQASRALRLAEVRYREGADDLLSVLDAQRTLFLSDDDVARLQLSRLQASVSLYRALGGGWQVDAPAAPAVSAARP